MLTLHKTENLSIFLCIICLTEGRCQLVAAGGILKTAVDSADTALYLINSHPLNQTWDGLQISVTASGTVTVRRLEQP